MADTLEELDSRTHLHPFTSIAEQAGRGPLIMREGRGVRLKDKRLISYSPTAAGAIRRLH
jgi:adenosylmethionine-8-amino-7-oxononanoate aminotransferase